ncbi:hypothetical protein FRX31_033560, partial [Thalictrum thalictroides]
DDMKTQVNAEPPCDNIFESGETCTTQEYCTKICSSKVDGADGICEQNINGRYRCICHTQSCTFNRAQAPITL